MEEPLRITLQLRPLTADQLFDRAAEGHRQAQRSTVAPRLSTLNAVRAFARAFQPL